LPTYVRNQPQGTMAEHVSYIFLGLSSKSPKG
jgi:hypothetical protein